VSGTPGADPAVALGQIQAADPAFNLELFKRLAFETYLAVKRAVQDRDLSAVVDLLGDSVYEDLRLDVSSLEARGAIQHYDVLTPQEMAIVAAERGPQGDAITLRIKAAALLYRQPEGHDVDINPSMFGSFTEFWTFSRPPGAGSAGAQRPECPTCGAPIDIDSGRICRYCKTLMPSPRAQTGWLVVAIQPAQESQG
jgi:predicted lipid-binding transport protein (Tim44 family)